MRGFLVNKFRGDPRLFDDGVDDHRRRGPAGRALGLVPRFAAASRLPAEDAVALELRHAREAARRIRIAVPVLPLHQPISTTSIR